MNQKIRALIVDDESLAREALLVMLKKDPEMEAIAACRNGEEAVKAIRELSPDIVFMDIQMPEMNGFQVIEQIGVRRMPATVFVTAFDQYALRAFEANALDYLLKPFDHDRFTSALEKAKKNVRQHRLNHASEGLFALLQDIRSRNQEPGGELQSRDAGQPRREEPTDRIAVKSGRRVYFLKTDEVDWVEAADDYISLHCGAKTHLIRETMVNFSAKLDRKFLRIHRSTIVNIERIKDIQAYEKGEYVITLTSGTRLRSSRSYRRELQLLLDDAR